VGVCCTLCVVWCALHVAPRRPPATCNRLASPCTGALARIHTPCAVSLEMRMTLPVQARQVGNHKLRTRAEHRKVHVRRGGQPTSEQRKQTNKQTRDGTTAPIGSPRTAGRTTPGPRIASPRSPPRRRAGTRKTSLRQRAGGRSLGSSVVSPRSAVGESCGRGRGRGVGRDVCCTYAPGLLAVLRFKALAWAPADGAGCKL
jgi:hypothetical protein